MTTFLLTLLLISAIWLYCRSELKIREVRRAGKRMIEKDKVSYTDKSAEEILKDIPNATDARGQVTDGFTCCLGRVAGAVAGGRKSISFVAWKFKHPWDQVVNTELFLQLKAVLEPKGYTVELYRDGPSIFIQPNIKIKVSW